MNVRNLFEVFACMMSINLNAKESGSKVTLSADGTSTAYLLSRVQRIGHDTRAIFPSVSAKICGIEESVYVFPKPVSKTFYVDGVDETDTDLIVYDKDGKCLCAEYGNEIEIDHLKEGIYFLSIDDYYVRFQKINLA